MKHFTTPLMKRKKSIDNKSIVQSLYLGCEDPLDALSIENILQFSFLDCILNNSRRNYRGNLLIFHEHSCWKSSCNPAACERNTTTVVASFIFFLQGLQKGVISSVPFFFVNTGLSEPQHTTSTTVVATLTDFFCLPNNTAFGILIRASRSLMPELMLKAARERKSN